MQLRDMVTSEPVTGQAEWTLREGVRQMRLTRKGSLLIEDKSGNVIGIFTERDVVAALANDAVLDEDILRDWMTPVPDVVAAGVDATSAAKAMVSGGYRHLPVLEDGKLIGVVSARDLLRVLVSDW